MPARQNESGHWRKAIAKSRRKPEEEKKKPHAKMKASPKETEYARETNPQRERRNPHNWSRKKTVVIAASVICATLLAAVLILTLGSTHAADGNQTTAIPADESPAVQAVLPGENDFTGNHG